MYELASILFFLAFFGSQRERRVALGKEVGTITKNHQPTKHQACS